MSRIVLENVTKTFPAEGQARSGRQLHYFDPSPGESLAARDADLAAASA